MQAADFAFPMGRVAWPPERHRDNCRMMVVDRCTGSISHASMVDFEQYVAGDEVWANNSFNIALPDQTYHPIYARCPGSHATPTAGLFLKKAQCDRLNLKLLTLHISGPRGQEDILAGYQSNVGWREWYTIPSPPSRRVVAIGTTVVKALENWARTGKTEGWSSLFVQPPFQFKMVQKLLTNFHFTREPLLALTCAFGGIDLIREAYEVAVAKNYLFGDYGDRLLMI